MILQAFPATLMLSGIFLLVTKTSHFCLKSKKKFPLVILLSWKIRIFAVLWSFALLSMFPHLGLK